jgi:hypothetical protein
MGINSLQDLYLHTRQHILEYTHTDTIAWSGIPTHDPSVLCMNTRHLHNRDFYSFELVISKHLNKYIVEL